MTTCLPQALNRTNHWRWTLRLCAGIILAFVLVLRASPAAELNRDQSAARAAPSATDHDGGTVLHGIAFRDEVSEIDTLAVTHAGPKNRRERTPRQRAAEDDRATSGTVLASNSPSSTVPLGTKDDATGPARNGLRIVKVKDSHGFIQFTS